jgi:F-type H+-transporting ATPase subunit alpha
VKRALAFEVALRSHVKSKYKDLFDRIEAKQDLGADDEKALVAAIEDFKKNGAY